MTETDLRWRLRQLPREIEPAHDLWPGIAARLQPVATRRPRYAWAGGLALAASLLIALVGWRLVAAPDAGPASIAAPQATDIDTATRQIVQTEARALTVEYRAALASYEALPVPADVKPGLDVLDASARDIRTALARSPDSVHLLQQLQRTYARRLELTQRAVAG